MYGGGEARVVGADEGLGRGPVEAVVNDQKIDSGGGGAGEGLAAGIYGGTEAGDAACVFQLEAVQGVGVVFPGVAAGAFVAKTHNFSEGRHGPERGAGG